MPAFFISSFVAFIVDSLLSEEPMMDVFFLRERRGISIVSRRRYRRKVSLFMESSKTQNEKDKRKSFR